MVRHTSATAKSGGLRLQTFDAAPVHASLLRTTHAWHIPFFNAGHCGILNVVWFATARPGPPPGVAVGAM